MRCNSLIVVSLRINKGQEQVSRTSCSQVKSQNPESTFLRDMDLRINNSFLIPKSKLPCSVVSETSLLRFMFVINMVPSSRKLVPEGDYWPCC